VGLTVGEGVGPFVVGEAVGVDVGLAVGISVGASVGTLVGPPVGARVGLGLGAPVGAKVVGPGVSGFLVGSKNSVPLGYSLSSPSSVPSSRLPMKMVPSGSTSMNVPSPFVST